MCTRCGCPFKSKTPPPDEFIRILIIGATGMTGMAVLSAVLTCVWFKVTVMVRRITGESVEDIMDKPLSRIVKGDMLEYETVLEAMMGNDALFFSTTFWDTMMEEREIQQGINVIKAAQEAGVKHVVYVGTPYSSLSCLQKCKYLSGKERVEAEVVSSGLPYTIVHLGFYYENLLSVFKPHRVNDGIFALALPMGDVPLNCGSVLDFGHCIAKIFLRPLQTLFKTIKLASGYHTVTELAHMLNIHFPKMTFFDPKIPVTVYRQFDFMGSQELASMFAFYQSLGRRWNQEVAFSYYGPCRSFSDWLREHHNLFLDVIFDNLDPSAEPVKTALASGSRPESKTHLSNSEASKTTISVISRSKSISSSFKKRSAQNRAASEASSKQNRAASETSSKKNRAASETSSKKGRKTSLLLKLSGEDSLLKRAMRSVGIPVATTAAGSNQLSSSDTSDIDPQSSSGTMPTSARNKVLTSWMTTKKMSM